MPTRTSAATAVEQTPSLDDSIEQVLEAHRKELTGYCYRMLGSGFEAEDAVQETMVRAWRGIDGFEGRSALRSWLYRIATNVCLDMLRGPQRRARPMDLGPSSTADSYHGPARPENTWVQPVADARVLPETDDPAELAANRETIRLAFVAALQHLPPRQRAVLILREVLRWQASEVAELLDTSVASVNSALQRARATLAAGRPRRDDSAAAAEIDDDQQELLARYVDAFERYDIPSLLTLLHDDAVLSMPPFPLWLRGPDGDGPVVPRSGHRVPGLPARGHRGQRLCRVRLLPLDRTGRPRALRHPGHRGAGREDLGPAQLPVPRAVPRLRPSDAARGLGVRAAVRLLVARDEPGGRGGT